MNPSDFPTPITDRYFEDYRPGFVGEYGSITVSQEEIVEFARRFDPQTFHTDPIRAARGPFGGLIASGWHTAALTMNRFITADVNAKSNDDKTALDAAGEARRHALDPRDHSRSQTFQFQAGQGTRPGPDRGPQPGQRNRHEPQGYDPVSVPEGQLSGE